MVNSAASVSQRSQMPCFTINVYQGTAMTFEIGERVIFRSLHGEAADNALQAYVELFGRERRDEIRAMKRVKKE
jgi:hypothetical protein